MVEISRDELKKLIAEAVADAHNANCPLSDDTRSEVGHFFGRLKDLGDGNLSIGIERMGNAVRWLSAVRDFGSKVGGKIAVTCALAILGAVALMAGAGVTQWIKRLVQ